MVVQSAHHPILISEAAEKTYHLPRNIFDNITTVTKKACRLGMIITNFREKFVFRCLHFQNGHVSQFLKKLIIVVKTAG